MRLDTNISSQHLCCTKGSDFVCWQLGQISVKTKKKGVWIWYDLILKIISLLDKKPRSTDS